MDNKIIWYKKLWFVITSSVLAGLIIGGSVVGGIVAATSNNNNDTDQIEEPIVVDDAYDPLPSDLDYIILPESGDKAIYKEVVDLSKSDSTKEGIVTNVYYAADVTNLLLENNDDSDRHIYKLNHTYSIVDYRSYEEYLINPYLEAEYSNIGWEVESADVRVYEEAVYFDTKSGYSFRIENNVIINHNIMDVVPDDSRLDGSYLPTYFYHEDSFLDQSIYPRNPENIGMGAYYNILDHNQYEFYFYEVDYYPAFDYVSFPDTTFFEIHDYTYDFVIEVEGLYKVVVLEKLLDYDRIDFSNIE